jgi:CBS domain-containing protein
MKLRDLCSRDVVTAEPPATLREASLLMRQGHVGALVVIERQGSGERPVGIVTDRDIVVAVIAVPGARPEGIRVGDIMSSPVFLVRESDGVFEALRTMSAHGVRRLPVVAEDGTLAGIVTADDVLRVMAAELANLGTALRRGREREATERGRLEFPS